MKLINKTYTTITIELTRKEMVDIGFDKIWDEIRESYSASDYDMESFRESGDGRLLYVSLIYKKNLKVIDGI